MEMRSLPLFEMPPPDVLGRAGGEVPVVHAGHAVQVQAADGVALLIVPAIVRLHEEQRGAIYRLYLDRMAGVNDWGLVDSSGEHIVGRHLEKRKKTRLYDLANSTSVWERRIAIMATFRYVKAGSFDETLRIADMLLLDTHDLIHKAVGWMLREVGKRDRAVAEAFLRPRYRRMPRTMLRYAIEKYPEALRLRYLRGDVRPGGRNGAKRTA